MVFPRNQYRVPFYFKSMPKIISGAVSIIIILLYSDDSAILAADKCVSNIEIILNNELKIVSENKLSIC